MTEQELAISRPVNTIEKAAFVDAYKSIVKFAAEQLILEKDYGVIPGTKKKSLYKQGADKLSKFIRVVPVYEEVSTVEDWEKGFFFYKVKCVLKDKVTGQTVGESIRSCNSMEKKYAWKWIDRSKVKKTPEDQAEQVNTIQAMAQKRAYVAAVVQAAMAGEIFEVADNDKEEAPGKPVTKEEDPGRTMVMGKFFMVAQERGFSPTYIKNLMYERFEVESMTEIANKDIMEKTEQFILDWDIVEKGQKPQRKSFTHTLKKDLKENAEEGDVVTDGEEDLKKPAPRIVIARAIGMLRCLRNLNIPFELNTDEDSISMKEYEEIKKLFDQISE